MVTIFRIRLQEKEKGGNIFSQTKLLKKGLELTWWQAFKIAFMVAFKGRTVIVQKDPSGDTPWFDHFHTQCIEQFKTEYLITNHTNLGLHMDRIKFTFIPCYSKETSIWLSRNKGA